MREIAGHESNQPNHFACGLKHTRYLDSSAKSKLEWNATLYSALLQLPLLHRQDKRQTSPLTMWTLVIAENLVHAIKY